MSAPGQVERDEPLYRFDERQRMIPHDPQRLAARVAQARPHDFASFRQTGIELMLLGRYDDALDHLDRALELVDTEPRRISVWINLGDVYRYRGDADTAETLYRRAVEHARVAAPEVLSSAVQHLGKALAERNQLAEAHALLAEAMRLRVAEGDPEEIEATRAALDTLGELPIPLPPTVTALLGESPSWSDDHEGMSGGVVFVSGAYWLKRGPKAVAEYERLTWLRGRGIDLPEVAAFEDDVLVLADAGAPSLAARARSEGAYAASIGTVMGAILRRLHSIPVTECPFDGGLDVVLAQARRNVVEGLVDADDFDDDNAGSTPADVLARLRAQRPEQGDPVVAHGDFTPPNVLENGILLDVGALGVADRYRDLALAVRDLRADFGEAEVSAFFTAYGLADPDESRLEYYRLLDELF
ncbi:APH(3') family aminoglycoside O-phosphotransferase [Nocardia sputi]|uniref:APH(3') family aminoglycoside O-phosphotransferase n=1 Tax=Nocardia sputi TaxID=2943705 RepID=UPI0020C1072E|nr:APH(3') family aminoglycoside O-phosphotransferase [Nocardia sputi]